MNIKDFFILITLVLIIACLGTFFVGCAGLVIHGLGSRTVLHLFAAGFGFLGMAVITGLVVEFIG